MAASIAYSHHEKWDGTGYPQRLQGEQIPLAARITAVADVFDALSSDRPYKKAIAPEECFAMMRRERGKHFLLVESVEQAESLQVVETEKIAYLTQTTLSLDDARRIVAVLHRRFPQIRGPRTQDICHATQNRQDAVREVATAADVVLVLGSKNSSNSIRLVEVSQECGTPAYLIDEVSALDETWLSGSTTVAVTAGASAPEHLVSECTAWLQARYGADFREHRCCEEDVAFRLPSLPVNLDLRPPPAAQRIACAACTA